jgi:transposase/ribosomal protein S15P/S13E
MGQPSLLPPDLEELIPENHVVRTVHEAIEQIDLSILYQQYEGGGTSSYHPKMMLKVLIYGYIERLYSSRRIAKALRENVNFMWLSGQNHPDFRTINRFRGEVMKDIIGDVFASVLELLIEQGHVKLEDYFIDGSKLEANARRHSAVWAKNTQRYKGQVRKKIDEILEEIERENAAEQAEYGDKDLPEVGEEAEIDSQRLKGKIDQLNERLRKKPKDKPLKKALRKLEKDYLPRLEKYEEQEKKLAGRNSYSKTDEEATFMRMKVDQRNPQAWPKPAYNVQLGTENQLIVGFSVHQQANDATCLIPHLEEVERNLRRLPKNWVGDAIYGTEENLAYAEEKHCNAYLKYPTFHKEEKASYRDDLFRAENFTYDPEYDGFICPEGRRLPFNRSYQRITRTGFSTHIQRYTCLDCSHCPVKADCTPGEGNRQISVSWNNWRLRAIARQLLTSEKGVKLRSRRGVEVESPFGHIKFNRKFSRFMLRGLPKVRTELGLLSLAHNFIKLAAV